MISFKIIIQSKTATFSKSFRGVSNITPVKFLKPDRCNQKKMQMTIQDLKSQNLILFEVISGSKSFGLAISISAIHTNRVLEHSSK